MHRNAPLTPEGRRRLCRLIESGWTVAAVAESMRVSRQTAHGACRHQIAGPHPRRRRLEGQRQGPAGGLPQTADMLVNPAPEEGDAEGITPAGMHGCHGPSSQTFSVSPLTNLGSLSACWQAIALTETVPVLT